MGLTPVARNEVGAVSLFMPQTKIDFWTPALIAVHLNSDSRFALVTHLISLLQLHL